MKNLFLAIAFLLIGSVGFATNNNIEVENLSDEHFFQNKSEISQFEWFYHLCFYYETLTIQDEYGTTLTVTFSYLGVSVGEEDCNLQIQIAKLRFADLL